MIQKKGEKDQIQERVEGRKSVNNTVRKKNIEEKERKVISDKGREIGREENSLGRIERQDDMEEKNQIKERGCKDW